MRPFAPSGPSYDVGIHNQRPVIFHPILSGVFIVLLYPYQSRPGGDHKHKEFSYTHAPPLSILLKKFAIKKDRKGRRWWKIKALQDRGITGGNYVQNR
jgi:hypothetical protein